MKKPANLIVVPKDGWHCKFPDGYEVRAQHPSHFLSQCFTHLEANGGDLSGGWQARMWQLVCDTHPEIESEDTEAPAERAVTSNDIWMFFNELKEAITHGATAVSEEEQDRRIGICLTCPKLTHVACGFGCGKVAEIISDLTLGRKSRRLVEAHKASCGVCACEISSLTAWPLDILKTVDCKVKFRSSEFAPGCWRLEEA